jgi:hypothetical protein
VQQFIASCPQAAASIAARHGRLLDATRTLTGWLVRAERTNGRQLHVPLARAA